MAKIYLVRHGKAKGEWGTERDPSLDQVGREQAKAAARSLNPIFYPTPRL